VGRRRGASRLITGAAEPVAHPFNLASPPPAIEMSADRTPYNEFPVTLDYTVASGTRVKLRLLQRRRGGCSLLQRCAVGRNGLCTLIAKETENAGET
jgi:hypothetical protein